MIAASVDSAIDRFDTTVRGCPDGWAACVDRAWAVIVVDMDWPPYYLRRFDARTRGCEPLALAVKGVDSFNLAARQLDYGDPAEVRNARSAPRPSRARRRAPARSVGASRGCGFGLPLAARGAT